MRPPKAHAPRTSAGGDSLLVSRLVLAAHADVAAGEVEVDYCLGLSYPLHELVPAIEVAAARGHGHVRVLLHVP